MLQSDEQVLRGVFNTQSAAHDTLNRYATIGMFAGFWPIVYNLSKNVRPSGCAFFALGYIWSYFNVVTPFTKSRFQSSLNSAAQPFADKYKIKKDADYLS